MTPELKSLIEDAARLLGVPRAKYDLEYCLSHGHLVTQSDMFNPRDPERGDLMKVAMAAELIIDSRKGECRIYFDTGSDFSESNSFTKGDYDSLCYAILRAASAVLKAREGE